MINQYNELPLNIYKASAGSGKTHLLTGFYIKLLFDNSLLPSTHSGEMKFSEILAVTFTNKATAEMKGRIIDELYLLSTNPSESDYWEDIVTSGTEKNDRAAISNVKQKATRLLTHILNEYSSFNISTIDSFFQKIVRSFARELNIPGNYDVELDSRYVLDIAVSNFLDKLNPQDDPDLFDWMMSFSKKMVSDGSNWDIRTLLQEMAHKVLGSETYRQHSEAIQHFTSDHKAMREYAKMLADLQINWRKETKSLGEQGVALMSQTGLEASDYTGKSKSCMHYFAKWAAGDMSKPTATFKKYADEPDGLYDKKKKPSPDAVTKMQRLMQQCVDHFSGTTYCNYLTAKALRTHFYELGILAYLDKEVTEYCNEQNAMLLSSTTEMLARLINKDDAPFIYEKVGTHIHSFMIDEFQDTSGMQWNNFKPLLSNALAEQYQNLIVGDVKQSIYRWRGGDWGLLNSEINAYEPDLHYDDSTALATNWRSHTAIIDFNNEFFKRLAPKLDEMLGNGNQRIQQIYNDVEQKYPPEKEGKKRPQGLVHIEYLVPTDEEGQPSGATHKDDMLEEAAKRLPEAIIELQRNGFEPRDIAILCRRNKECHWAAEVLLKYKQDHPDCPYGLDIISNEALLLSVRPIIHVLISLMQHLQSPKSPIVNAIARTGLMQLEGLSSEEALRQYFSMTEDDRKFHPELAHRPLYEMTEQLIALLPADAQKKDAPYLQAFRDVVLDFSSSQSSDLTAFLEWWDQKSDKLTIATPVGQNAIQILSVHKSKGLGMPAIVMPFASWQFDIDTSHKELIWCEPKADPFALDERVLLPVQLEKSLEETIFAQEYKEERERAVIDNLNTAYVAFTRAKEALVIFTPKPSQQGSMLEHYLMEYTQFKGSDTKYTVGSWQRAKKDSKNNGDKQQADQNTGNSKQKKRADEVEIITAEKLLNLPNDTTNGLPQLSILHDPKKPDVTAKERGTYIHTVLQNIRVASDAEQVIERLYKRGEIDASIITKHEMQQIIGRLLAMPEVQPWFKEGLQVLNELALMDNQKRQRRPDRIVIDPSGTVTVIDYKTGSSHASYIPQVINYMALLRQIGFKKVEGYLLFLKDEKVIKV